MQIITKYNNFQEVEQLYSFLRRMVTIFKFGKNNQVKNDVEELICSIQAFDIFEHLENWHGCGVICNNLGNIHLRNMRYNEAIEEYDKAINYMEDIIRK